MRLRAAAFQSLMMSTKSNCCACCGLTAIDDVKLKMCGDCDLVKYCSEDCQKNHRDRHEEACKKRVEELRDKDLFTQPDSSHLGECPICFLPLSLDARKATMMGCCGKFICDGCHYTNQKREFEEGLERRCVFCREPMPKSKEEADERILERVKKNDPAALTDMGKRRQREGDYESALEYFTKAVEFGGIQAHDSLAVLYHKGYGVEKDMKKKVYHLEQAAIGGHPYARHMLGCEEAGDGRYKRAKKHFMIAANLGWHDSLKYLMKFYQYGHASKEDYASALSAYQAAVEATKSSDREKAEEAEKNGEVAITRFL